MTDRTIDPSDTRPRAEAVTEAQRFLPAGLAFLSDACLAGLVSAVARAGEEAAAVKEAELCVARDMLNVAKAEIEELRIHVAALSDNCAAREVQIEKELETIAAAVARTRSAPPCQGGRKSPAVKPVTASPPMALREAESVLTNTSRPYTQVRLRDAETPSPAPEASRVAKSVAGDVVSRDNASITIVSASRPIIAALDEMVVAGECPDRDAAAVVLIAEALAARAAVSPEPDNSIKDTGQSFGQTLGSGPERTGSAALETAGLAGRPERQIGLTGIDLGVSADRGGARTVHDAENE